MIFQKGRPFPTHAGRSAQTLLHKAAAGAQRGGDKHSFCFHEKNAGHVIRPAFRQKGCAARPCRGARLPKIFLKQAQAGACHALSPTAL